MGHRKARKRDRRTAQKFGFDLPPAAFADPGDDPAGIAALLTPGDDMLAPWEERGSLLGRVAVKACGQCREFIEDRDGGRGSCLHPGSGIAFPWTDTPACDFYAPRRR